MAEKSCHKEPGAISGGVIKSGATPSEQGQSRDQQSWDPAPEEGEKQHPPVAAQGNSHYPRMRQGWNSGAPGDRKGPSMECCNLSWKIKEGETGDEASSLKAGPDPAGNAGIQSHHSKADVAVSTGTHFQELSLGSMAGTRGGRAFL